MSQENEWKESVFSLNTNPETALAEEQLPSDRLQLVHWVLLPPISCLSQTVP